MTATFRRLNAAMSRLPDSLVLIFVRIVAAHVFWASGRTKVDGIYSPRPEVVDLFRDEYQLPLIAPEIAAPLVTVAEHVLPILLFVGLLSRFSAIGLILMTLVIQFLVYPDAWWPQHSLWLGLLIVIVWRGPGRLSLDHLFKLERA